MTQSQVGQGAAAEITAEAQALVVPLLAVTSMHAISNTASLYVHIYGVSLQHLAWTRPPCPTGQRETILVELKLISFLRSVLHRFAGVDANPR